MLLHELGLEVLTCGQQDEDLRFASVHPLVRPLVSIVPLQRLTAALAHKNGTNPDEIHRDVEPWASAMGRVILQPCERVPSFQGIFLIGFLVGSLSYGVKEIRPVGAAFITPALQVIPTTGVMNAAPTNLASFTLKDGDPLG